MELMREVPEDYSAETVVVRLIDALHYRYARAMEGVTEEDRALGLGNDTMNLGQLIDHTTECIQWVRDSVFPDHQEKSDDPFVMLDELRDYLLKDGTKLDQLSIAEKSFWHAISGPLADALTHVGQINIIKSSQKGQRTQGQYFS